MEQQRWHPARSSRLSVPIPAGSFCFVGNGLFGKASKHVVALNAFHQWPQDGSAVAVAVRNAVSWRPLSLKMFNKI